MSSPPRDGSPTDGATPQTGLIQATDGNFYGATAYGGADEPCDDYGNGTGCGTVYKITPSGTLTIVYEFCSQTNCTDGYYPNALVQDTDGSLYGTTFHGGTGDGCSGGCGTVFSLSVRLAPFVELKPASGKVGATVNILGSLLEGATSVTFNGTAAAFTVESDSLIKAAVPTGATSGTVEVTKPSGTVSSSVPFTVIG
jgi:uncharacterized repeat protein (TIGR03803 family)